MSRIVDDMLVAGAGAEAAPQTPLSSGEAFYDAEIAPALAELSKRCEARGLSLLAVVEFAPEQIGRTLLLRPSASWPLRLLDALARAGRNLDGWMLAVARFCRDAKIDTSRCVFLSPTAGPDTRAAVSYALDRIQRDPDLGYQAGYGTEVFRRLCLAEAEITGKPVADVEKARRETFYTRPARKRGARRAAR